MAENTTVEHTPGPWEAEPADMFGDHNIVLADRVEHGDCRAVAAVVSNMRPEGEVATNARLIAAAPDIYEALQKARNTLAGVGMAKIAADICDAALLKASPCAGEG